jgi:hypothetical protein
VATCCGIISNKQALAFCDRICPKPSIHPPSNNWARRARRVRNLPYVEVGPLVAPARRAWSGTLAQPGRPRAAGQRRSAGRRDGRAGSPFRHCAHLSHCIPGPAVEAPWPSRNNVAGARAFRTGYVCQCAAPRPLAPASPFPLARRHCGSRVTGGGITFRRVTRDPARCAGHCHPARSPEEAMCRVLCCGCSTPCTNEHSLHAGDGNAMHTTIGYVVGVALREALERARCACMLVVNNQGGLVWAVRVQVICRSQIFPRTAAALLATSGFQRLDSSVWNIED